MNKNYELMKFLYGSLNFLKSCFNVLKFGFNVLKLNFKRILITLFSIIIFICTSGAIIYSAKKYVYSSYNSFKSEMLFTNYQTFSIKDFQPFDPYVPDKKPIPIPKYVGLSINLEEKLFLPYIEVMLGEGEFTIDFYNENTPIATLLVDTIIPIEEDEEIQPEEIILQEGEQLEEEIELDDNDPAKYLISEGTKQILTIPLEALALGYDNIKITPKSGRNFFVAYVGFLEHPKDNILTLEAAPLNKANKSAFNLTGLFAYYENYNENTLTLSITSVSNHKIELISIQNESGKQLINFNENKLLEPHNKVKANYITYTFLDAPKKLGTNKNDIYINYKYVDSDAIKQTKVNPFSRRNETAFTETLISTQDNTDEFDFIVNDEYVVKFKGEEIIIDRPLFIPSGKTFVLSKGQTIDIKNNAFIVSRSPVYFAGSEEAPILVHSSDSSGTGIVIMECNSKSKIEYTTFNNLSNPSSGSWLLTGAVTFYESDVDIFDSNFYNNRCEDGLNIVRSNFNIISCHFKNTFADAFDSDFSKGVFDNCLFENTGNDAFDVSTTVATVKNTNFINIGDKCISGGENSTLELYNLNGKKAVLGVAAKDYTYIKGDNIIFEDVTIGAILYRKKPEFGPGYMDITNFKLKGRVDLEYLMRDGSELRLNGKNIIPKNKKKEAVIFEKIINGEKL